ncbi:MAG: hypothetical protein ACLSUZ_07870 [Bifidobacterium pseudocatenulatum]
MCITSDWTVCMAVTVREVLDDTLVATAEPQVEVAGDSLDKPVRWVFTNEREDVASFLAGGELLVVEGRSLVADGRENVRRICEKPREC